jgi:hypothetical protein
MGNIILDPKSYYPASEGEINGEFNSQSKESSIQPMKAR